MQSMFKGYNYHKITGYIFEKNQAQIRDCSDFAGKSGYLRAVECIQSYGITVNGCFILGLDGQTPDTFEEVFDFVERSGFYDVQITYLTPFPGTPLWARLFAEGRLLSEDALERCSLFDINFRPDQMTVGELREGFHELTARLYAPNFVRQRTRRFRHHRSRGFASSQPTIADSVD